MSADCEAPVTHVDQRGFVYCAQHAVRRKMGGDRCRKLRPAELARAERNAREHDLRACVDLCAAVGTAGEGAAAWARIVEELRQKGSI